MSKTADAAQCWAAIEQQLAGTAMPDDRIDAVRAACIRIIGEAIGGMMPAPKKDHRRGGQRVRGGSTPSPDKAGLGFSAFTAKPGKTTRKRAARTDVLQTVGATASARPLKLDDSLPPAHAAAFLNHAMPANLAQRSTLDEAELTRKLAGYLDRACGYSQDDEVGYDTRGT